MCVVRPLREFSNGGPGSPLPISGWLMDFDLDVGLPPWRSELPRRGLHPGLPPWRSELPRPGVSRKDRRHKKDKACHKKDKDKKHRKKSKRHHTGGRETAEVNEGFRVIKQGKTKAKSKGSKVQAVKVKAIKGMHFERHVKVARHEHSANVEVKEAFTLGTDFSGLEAPSRALRNVGLAHRLVFCCEASAPLRALIMHDVPPELPIYEDMESRHLPDVPHVDMHVAGPSCPPWSKAGQLRGERDSRACHMVLAVRYIITRQPRCFLLENVDTLKTRFKA